MKISSKLLTVVSFISSLPIDKTKITHGIKDHVKVLKHLVRGDFSKEKVPMPPITPLLAQEGAPLTIQLPLNSSATDNVRVRVESLWKIALSLDILLSFLSPDIPEDSPAYSLFRYGTKVLKLEGVLKILDSERPSDVRVALVQPLFALARVVRLVARSVHFCTYICSKPPLTSPPQTMTAAVEQVARDQEEQLDLACQVEQEAEKQTALIDRLSQLSSDRQATLRQLLEKLRPLLDDPNAQEKLNALAPHQLDIQHSLTQIANLRERLKVLMETRAKK